MIKKIIKSTSPKFYKYLQFLKREHDFRRENGGRDYRAKKALVARYGKKVIAGPFQGMIYGDDANGSAYIPKLIGSYEEELYPTISEIIASNPATVIDIGCAEGYYAVGLAKCLPQAQVYAFDTNKDARGYCMELAKLNGLSNQVHVRGFFNEEALKQFASESAFFLSDCEGYEAEIFNPASVELLKKCDFLIEFHDMFVPGITETLKERFSLTHSIQIIDTKPRDVKHHACLAVVPAEDREGVLAEYRGTTQQWGYFRSLER